MTRLFYRIEDKMYFDRGAFVEMAGEHSMNIDRIYDIFGIDQKIENHYLVEV